MYIERLTHIWNTVLLIPLLSVLFVAAIFLIKKKIDKSGLVGIAAQKAKKQQLINIVLEELKNQEVGLNALITDMKVLKCFNGLHAEQLLQSASKAQLVYQYLDILESEYVKNSIIGFVDNVHLLATEVKKLEEDQYTTKLEFQKILEEAKMHYYYKFQEDYEFVDTINSERGRVKELLDYYSSQREHMYHRVKSLAEEKNSIESSLLEYQKRHINSKKFYFRYLTLA